MAKDKLSAEQAKLLSERINDLFASLNTDDVSADSSGYVDLPEGYFLAEVKSAELTVSKSGNPQAALRLKVVEDGRDLNNISEIVPNSKNISFGKYYRLINDTDAKKFVSDMLKFEIDANGTTIPKEAFTSEETIDEALSLLEGTYIYVQNSVTVNDDGTKSSWINLISWKRATELGLPVE